MKWKMKRTDYLSELYGGIQVRKKRKNKMEEVKIEKRENMGVRWGINKL